MKALYRPPRPSSKYARDMRAHVQLDVDRYLDAKKQTMADRICAMMCITLNSEFGFGPARLNRFWRAFQSDVRQHLQDWQDTDDGLLFLRLERIGMSRLAGIIEDDYAAEREAVKGSVFDPGEDCSNDSQTVSRPGDTARSTHQGKAS